MAERGDDGEALGLELIERLEREIAAALRRRPAQEAALAGALRALTPHSPRLARLAANVTSTLGRRGTLERPLYASAVRALAEASGAERDAVLRSVLGDDESCGLSTLSAASCATGADIGSELVRLAGSRHPQTAFAAEVGRVARGESDGRHLLALSPRIKEAHRIALCVELFVPLLWRAPVGCAIAPALAVLRDAERHLGRWLVLAEVASRAGDPVPLQEAEERAREGPGSARSAWGMVAWALGSRLVPPGRPTVELVSRLSDRPSADRDTTFLYRLAAARVPSARPMLESLVKGEGIASPAGLRSALFLARDHGRDELLSTVKAVSENPKKEALRGLAACAFVDAGGEVSADLADALAKSRHISTACWGSILRVRAHAPRCANGALVSESTFRRLQLGWVE